MCALNDLPPALRARYEELVKLCEEYPINIPVSKASKFLDTDGDSLRAALDKGSARFGWGWQKSLGGNRAFYISTMAFYLTVTQGMITYEDVKDW
ncbi:MAG: hypothetical protein LBR74_07760 [Eubacterium sp.]|jgi:hypothetical protein|nr:hypothetical protein [Eubacterium sp.]